jgi:CubicO group peptidase (beta-lactamase class C family)
MKSAYVSTLSLLLQISAATVLAADLPATPNSAKSFRETIQNGLKAFVEHRELAGAVALAADSKGVLASAAAGWKDMDTKVPLSEDTVFWVASQTKPITAAALLMLVDRGLLSVDDPVSKFIPEFAHLQVAEGPEGGPQTIRPARETMLIRHLLMHSAGIGTKTQFDGPTFDFHPISVRARAHAKEPLQWEPGTNARYSNGAYTVLGYLVEVISGEPYGEFLEKHIFEPLRMKDTTFWPSDAQCARMMTPYRTDEAWTKLTPAKITILATPLHDRTKRHPTAQLGLFSTAQDLARFYRMLLNDGSLDGAKILSPESARKMRDRQTPEAWTGAFSYGMITKGDTFGHMGSFGTNTLADRNTGLICVWLTQQTANPGDAWEAEYIFQKAAKALTR